MDGNDTFYFSLAKATSNYPFHTSFVLCKKIFLTWNLTRSRKKEATAKQAFTFSGASLTKPQVAPRATTDAKRLGSGSVTSCNKIRIYLSHINK